MTTSTGTESLIPAVDLNSLDHRDISTTMDVYGGLFHGYDDGVAEALDEAFTASL
ncbi:MAG: hypothetical protein MUQ27_02410 [Acidimicrobiia bacterium]|nr:hypothetical protein [Acidimicrobiia bacterium]